MKNPWTTALGILAIAFAVVRAGLQIYQTGDANAALDFTSLIALLSGLGLIKAKDAEKGKKP